MSIAEVRTETPLAGDLILGPDGPIARAITGYEARQPQIDMANLVDTAFANSQHALIEAGTGTGKSWAYLIPAIRSGKRVVISTDTITLQQQLVDKDLPLLARTLDEEFTFAIAKGRSNWFCERNAISYMREYARMDPAGAAMAEELFRVFDSGGWDGDKSTLTMQVPDGKWGLVSGDESCTGKTCPNAERCPYLAARAKWEDATIIVTNHTMILLDKFIRARTNGNMGALPDHSIWVGDEAHTLADKAVDVFGVEISWKSPGAYIKRVQRQAKHLGLTIEVDAKKLHAASELFFNTFHGATKDQQLLSDYPEQVVDLARERMALLVEQLKPVRLAIYWAAKDVDIDDKSRLGALDRLYDAANEMIENLQAIFGEADPDYVIYTEMSGGFTGDREVTLHRKPIETRPIFRRILDDLESAVFCSATLATGTGSRAWAPVADELGLEISSTLMMQVESPFNYPLQVTGYIPRLLPASSSPDYHAALAEEVLRIITFTEGRAFVLFTSLKDMRAVYELVLPHAPYNCVMQGQMPKDQLIREFKETPGSVLFGNKSFWAGVDIPGDALSCVILAKLPFPNNMHPLNKAREQRIEARGGKGFRDFSLPRCIRDVKQGFGRLIRTQQDTGVFAILDSRMRTARYGGDIAGALPDFPCSSSLGES